MNSRQRTLGHAAALMTILIWGTTFVSTKVLLRDFTPVTVLFTRFVIGYAFLWCLRPRLLPLSGWKKAPIYKKLDEAIQAVGKAEGVVYIFDLARTPIYRTALEAYPWTSLCR